MKQPKFDLKITGVNGFDYGEEKDLVGKLNKIIEVLNSLQANTQ